VPSASCLISFYKSPAKKSIINYKGYKYYDIYLDKGFLIGLNGNLEIVLVPVKFGMNGPTGETLSGKILVPSRQEDI
jgi:hypothetical protein